MPPHNSQKEVWKFVGVINYHHNIWPRSSYTLASLNKLRPINKHFKWTKVEQDDFNIIKRIVACDALLTYPGFNETFRIRTNDSALQLGATISHKGKPITFCSRKLTGAQK